MYTTPVRSGSRRSDSSHKINGIRDKSAPRRSGGTGLRLEPIRRTFLRSVAGQIVLYLITFLTAFYCMDEQTWAYNFHVLQEQRAQWVRVARTLQTDEDFIKSPGTYTVKPLPPVKAKELKPLHPRRFSEPSALSSLPSDSKMPWNEYEDLLQMDHHHTNSKEPLSDQAAAFVDRGKMRGPRIDEKVCR